MSPQEPSSVQPSVVVSQHSMILSRLQSAPQNERDAILIAELQTHVASVLKSRDLPSPEAGFAHMGMDSLMAIELKNRLENSTGKQVPSTLVVNHPNLRPLSR